MIIIVTYAYIGEMLHLNNIYVIGKLNSVNVSTMP